MALPGNLQSRKSSLFSSSLSSDNCLASRCIPLWFCVFSVAFWPGLWCDRVDHRQHLGQMLTSWCSPFVISHSCNWLFPHSFLEHFCSDGNHRISSIKLMLLNPTTYYVYRQFNPLNAELNPIYHLLALLGAHHILHVSRVRVNMQQFYVLPHTAVFMCFVWISEQTAIISLYSINWLVCVTETECVYCAVRTVFKYNLGKS